MKKKVCVVGMAIVMLGVGVVLSNLAEIKKSKAATIDTNNVGISMESSSHTGKLKKQIEAKLNQNGISDEEIDKLPNKYIEKFNHLTSENDISVFKGYYLYDENTHKVTQISNNAAIKRIKNNENGRFRTDSTCGNENRVSTKMFTMALYATNRDKKKGLVDISAFYTWLEIPKNLGRDVFTMELGSKQSYVQGTQNVYASYEYETYKEKHNSFSSYLEKNEYHFNHKTKQFPEKCIDYSAADNCFSYKAFKMPTDIITEVWSCKQGYSEIKLSKNEIKKLEEKKLTHIKLSGITYVLELTTAASGKMVDISTHYYHQIKDVNVDFSITAGLPPVVSGNVTITKSDKYEQLPLSGCAKIPGFVAK